MRETLKLSVKVHLSLSNCETETSQARQKAWPVLDPMEVDMFRFGPIVAEDQ